MAKFQVGDVVSVKLLRKGEEQTVSVTLEKLQVAN
jgi:S1-C subfamily serine protease